MRDQFQRQMTRLRDEILTMGSIVGEEMELALRALNRLDVDLAQQVRTTDKTINAIRFRIEADCSALIATQQPAAGDMRSLITVMNMIVDLERMGDQAKGIAKVIPHLYEHSHVPLPTALQHMGKMGLAMLRDAMTAYSKEDVELAKQVIDQDREVDRLFTQVYNTVMEQMARAKEPNKIEANYHLLRVARELERFADLATNLADRSIYQVTGNLQQAVADANIKVAT
jgi:phosphate transport system protein